MLLKRFVGFEIETTDPICHIESEGLEKLTKLNKYRCRVK